MLLEESNASTVLTWVRPDLDKHLNQIRTQIESIAGSNNTDDGIASTSESLTQLQYTFEALVLQGASKLVGEMNTLCEKLRNGHVRDNSKAFAALMDAIVVVPSYLDRLQAGHHDLPILLLPVINDLRSAYNANIVSEATLFSPDLDVDIPELERQTEEKEETFDEPAPVFLELMKRQYETSLLQWLQKQDDTELLQPIHTVCETLSTRLEGMQARRLWWIASIVVNGLRDGVTDNDVQLRRLFARLHLTIKTLAEKGEENLDLEAVDAISQALLFHIAQAESGNANVDLLRKRFNLDELVPDRGVLIRARGAITGRNRDLYMSLGTAVRDELSMVKDALDLELRTGEVEQERRRQSHDALLRLKDTLEMMGLGDSAESIAALMPAFEASATADNSDDQSGEDGSEDGPNGTSNETLLMTLAEKLIQVESVVDEQIATLGEPLLTTQDSGYIELPAHEQARIRSHLLNETVISLHQVEDAVRRHFDGANDADYLSGLEQVAGAMELLGEKDTGILALKLRNALDNLLRVAKQESQVDSDKLENLTDAVAAFELYLAACRDQQSNRTRFLDIIKDRLERLPIGEMEVVGGDATAAEEDGAEAQASTGDEAKQASSPQSLDSELLGVFVEEYQDVKDMLDKQIPAWIANQNDSNLMADIRRGFHTLKGSGRMVGAYELGDFAWHVEELINNFLDNNIDAIDDIGTLLTLANAALPDIQQRLLQKPTLLEAEGISAIGKLANDIGAGNSPAWGSLDQLLPMHLLSLVPGSEALEPISGDVNISQSETDDAADLNDEIPSDEILNEMICKEFSGNLETLTGLMEEVSKNRSTIADEEHIIAAHTIAGTAALSPLSREGDIAKALEGFLIAQRGSKKMFTDTAMWTLATCLVHLNTCLAIHQGDEEAELSEDEQNQIEQLLALTDEYEVVAQADEPEETSEAGAKAQVSEQDSDSAQQSQTASEADSVDTEILALFLQEATDVLEHCDTLLNNWRDNLPNLKIVQNLQREIHTFKGGARMSGVSSMGDLSHAMETLLEQIAGQVLPPSVAAIEALEQGCDRLNGWVEQAARGQIPQIGSALVDFETRTAALLTEHAEQETEAEAAATETEQVAPATEQAAQATKQDEPQSADAGQAAEQAGEQVPESEAEQPPEASADDTDDATQQADATDAGEKQDSKAAASEAPEVEKQPVKSKEAGDVEAITPIDDKPVETIELPENLPAEASTLEESGDSSGPQQIRVNADLLDSLVNSAGEISIFRSRLEQQVSGQRDTLKEFDETVSRLREQFRKLEIETETQIRSRYQQETNNASEEFDPLELDRFSSMQQLSRSLSESVSDLLNLQELLDESARKSEALLVQQSRVSTELQEGLMQTRMVHFATIAPRLRRVVRSAASETGKKALLHLRMTDGGDQLDRNVLERITAPLEHLLRNAIAHGIESPKERRKAKKPADGEINVTVSSEATEFVVRVEDDGGGLDRDAIRKRAIESGLLDKGANPQPQQLMQFILQSGFSTSETVTGLSGRGVGMDVVNSEIKQIGGSIEIDSEPGKGSRFTIRIPFTLAVMQAIGVVAGDHRYLIPLASVAGVARMLPADYRKLLESESPVYEFAGDKFSVLELEPLLGEHSTPLGDDTVSILLIKAGDQRAAFRVPELLGHREVVIKPVGPQISSVPGILGGTITGDGQVVIIIDSGPLIRQALMAGASPVLPMTQSETRRKQLLALVVDDSITMRKVTSRVLEGRNFEVITARDGVDATEQMQDRVPDLLLLDVEMPRMDGYQVAEYVRADARLREVPIIMITSRGGEKHRERGKRAGADGYITKPYKEADLIDEVKQLLRHKGSDKG